MELDVLEVTECQPARADHLVDNGETLTGNATLEFRCEVVLGSEQASRLPRRRRLRIEKTHIERSGE